MSVRISVSNWLLTVVFDFFLPHPQQKLAPCDGAETRAHPPRLGSVRVVEA